MALGFMGAAANLFQIAVEMHRLAWKDLIGQQSGSFEASLATLDDITDSSKSEE
jgi:hypothetical protein